VGKTATLAARGKIEGEHPPPVKPRTKSTHTSEDAMTTVRALALALALTTSQANAATVRRLASGWLEIQPGGDTMCARGQPYSFFVLEGTSERLIVDFLGGGACWDASSCKPGSALFTDNVDDIRARAMAGDMPGAYDPSNAANPLRDWTRVVVPYCTGDVHWGDADKVYDPLIGAPYTVHHRGAANVRAVLAWLQTERPSPDRLLVTGCSAGSYGSAYWAPHLRRLYPEAIMRQIGEAGVGVTTASFTSTSFPIWNVTASAPRWIPDLDPERVDWTKLTFKDFMARAAGYDSDVEHALYTTDGDLIQRLFYVKMGGLDWQWRAKMLNALDGLEASLPNFRSYVAPGSSHCATVDDGFYDVESSGVAFRDWLDEYANGGVAPASVRP
jgi:hypothetical protein